MNFVKHFALVSYQKIILMDNGNENHETFSLFKIGTEFEKIGEYQFINENDELLDCCRAQGNKMCFWKNNQLYLTTIDYVIEENSFAGDKEISSFVDDLNNQLLNSFLTQVLNKNEIERLLKSGANINAKNEYGDTILWGVLAYQDFLGVNLDIIQYLIDIGADANHQLEGFNSLYPASLTQNKELVELLIKNGADVNCVSTEDPESLLNWADFKAGEFIGKPEDNKMEEIVKLIFSSATIKR